MADVQGFLQFSFVLPAALTVAGWFVVAAQTERREFRKEVREQIKELRASIDEVRVRAEAYWLVDASASGSAAIALVSEVRRLGRYLQNMQSAGLSFDATTLVVDIRRLATGGDFQSSGRIRSAADEDRLMDLSGVLEDALLAVDSAFYERFASKRKAGFHKWLPLFGLLALKSDEN